MGVLGVWVVTMLELLREYVDINQKSPIKLPGITSSKGFPILLRDAGFKVGAEIGVERGRNSARLCKLIPGLSLVTDFF